MADSTPAQSSKIPDVFGHDGRVQMVANMLSGIQSRKYQNELEAAANGKADDQPSVTAPNRTVAEEREWLKKREAEIAEKFADVMPDVSKLVENRESART